MAEVSRKLSTGIYRLSPLKTCHTSLLTARHAQKSGQFCGTHRVFLILAERRSLCASRVIITRSYWSRSHDTTAPIHTSKTAYYDILKVSSNATQSQIKTAYYRQSFLYHPDKNPGREEAAWRFAQISEAYNILGDITLRKKYDRGLLSLSDVQSAGRPSSKDPAETASRLRNTPRERRARSSTTVGGKPVFDFDAFYQAHYGEQLQREQAVRRWRKRLHQKEQEHFRQWKLRKTTEMVFVALLTLGVTIFATMRS